MWRGEFFKIGKRDFTFIREMRVTRPIPNEDSPSSRQAINDSLSLYLKFIVSEDPIVKIFLGQMSFGKKDP